MSFSYHRPSAYLPPQPGSYAPGPAGPSWGYGGGPPHPPPPAAPPMPPAAPVAPAGSASSGMRKPAGSGGGVRHVEAEWVLTLEQVYRLSPSQRDGLDDATERRFRREGCRLAEEMALKLDMYGCCGVADLILEWLLSGLDVWSNPISAQSVELAGAGWRQRRRSSSSIASTRATPLSTTTAMCVSCRMPCCPFTHHFRPCHSPVEFNTMHARTSYVGHGRRRCAAGREGGGARP